VPFVEPEFNFNIYIGEHKYILTPFQYYPPSTLTFPEYSPLSGFYTEILYFWEFLFTTASRPGLGPIQPPIKWVPEYLSLGVKRPGREAGYSLSPIADVKNVLSYTSTPPVRLMAWCLV